MPKPFLPWSEEDVEKAAADGLTQAEIGARLGMSMWTVRRRKKDNKKFQEAYERGRMRAYGEVTSKLFSLVREGNLGAIVWFEKTRKGYSDRVQQEMSGRDGEAIEIKSTVFDHSSAVASIAARSVTNPGTPGENEIRGDGETLG